MGLPFFGVENVFSVRQFPKHVLTADQEDTGREAFRVADGRRSKLDFWAATTPNAEHSVQADGAAAAAILVRYFGLDRGHNLDGKNVKLEHTAATANPAITQFSANAVAAAISDGADVRTLTVNGLDGIGGAASDTLVLTGAVEVVGTQTFSQILKCSLSASDGARTVTVRQGAGGTTRATLGPDITTTWEIVADLTVPASAGGQIDDANGCHTDEGAFLKRLGADTTAEQFLRLRIPAMGAGLTPRVIGLWAGTQWVSGNIFLPLTDEDDVLIAQRAQTTKGWSGSTIHIRKRVGDLIFKLPSLAAFTDAAKHIRDNFGRGRLMWIIHDDANSQRAVLVQRPLGRAGFQFPTDFSNRTAQVAWEEYEPLVELPGS